MEDGYNGFIQVCVICDRFNVDDRAQIIMHNFERASGFPKIIGAIDGTHIKIEAPKQNPTDYINRKGYHSIQLQGRMRSLLHCLPMTRVDLMSEYIVACCVIHNICVLRGDELTIISVPSPIDVTTQVCNRNERQAANGVHKRNMIMHTLQNRYRV
ncbi:uncharacterized protein LOC116852623 isoform X2 [Odontomachus brunneus]|uniref:uncharacterized protein LOC116852623 isoform X2 n=1 Tax=Odontomachus brunneus TaxID=486640 RepID=UPI0013F274D3|nr:uncharacterized protein LOC116852623 isoform X2 [Odontomachus brunneus]